jgi:hypothetical protein
MNDGGLQWWQTTGIAAEYEEWLADENAKHEYEEWLNEQRRNLSQTEATIRCEANIVESWGD